MSNIGEEMIYHTEVGEQILHLHLGFLQEGIHPFREGLRLDVEALLLQRPYSASLKILWMELY